MAIFYKGVSPGTHLHSIDLRVSGLSPRRPGSRPSPYELMNHVCDGTTLSCYISLTRSYGVARAYALSGRIAPSSSHPGYVYEIELSNRLPPGLDVIDPISEMSRQNANVLASISYHHSIGEHEEALGLRLDLDKKATLDTIPNADIDHAIRKNVETIWRVVVEEQSAQR